MSNVNLKLKYLGINVDITSFVGVLKSKLEKLYDQTETKALFANISELQLSKALVNAINILLEDRFTEGLGKGGWGHSEKVHAKEFFGEQAVARTEDSVMASINAILALRECISLLRQSDSKQAISMLKRITEIVYNDFSEYIEKRWNKKYGYGGTLKYCRENDWNILTSYRHTAWLLLLWLKDLRYVSNILPTYKYLLENFEEIDWKSESIFTDFATYSAFKSALDYNHQTQLLNISNIPTFLSCLEASILSKYDIELSGWTFEHLKTEENKNRWYAARQPYTLCVLAEMVDCFNSTSELAYSMKHALNQTISGGWRASEGECGISKMPNEKPDTVLTSIGISVLLRKRIRTPEEKYFLKGSLEFVITSLAENSNSIRNSYLWPMTYFIRDICNLLNNAKVF